MLCSDDLLKQILGDGLDRWPVCEQYLPYVAGGVAEV
jgi:hypothetical protein